MGKQGESPNERAIRVSNYSELTQSVGTKIAGFFLTVVIVSNYSELTQSVGIYTVVLDCQDLECFQLFRINPIGGEFV